MADNDNTFLNADYMYEDVEGEAGKNLNLIPDQKLNLVGLIQNRFRYINTHLKSLNKQFHMLKKCLSLMSENLLYLNEKKYYENLNYNYDILLDELKQIKIKLDNIPDEITFRLLKEYSLSDLSFLICELNVTILKYMNHITPNNLFMIFDLFLGTEKLYDNVFALT